MLKVIKSLATGCVLLVFFGAAATATTYNFGGSFSGGPLAGAYSGSFSFDPSIASGSNPADEHNLYQPVSFILRVFDGTADEIEINFTGGISIHNDNPLQLNSDTFLAGKVDPSGGGAYFSEADPLETHVPGQVVEVSVNLLDDSGALLTDTALSTGLAAAVNLGDWLGKNLVVKYLPPGTQDFTQATVLFGQLTSLEAAATVPLPATLPLFGAGLGALGLFGWRRKRNAAALAA
jgi:hypothetical protein